MMRAVTSKPQETRSRQTSRATRSTRPTNRDVASCSARRSSTRAVVLGRCFLASSICHGRRTSKANCRANHRARGMPCVPLRLAHTPGIRPRNIVQSSQAAGDGSVLVMPQLFEGHESWKPCRSCPSSPLERAATSTKPPEGRSMPLRRSPVGASKFNFGPCDPIGQREVLRLSCGAARETEVLGRWRTAGYWQAPASGTGVVIAHVGAEKVPVR